MGSKDVRFLRAYTVVDKDGRQVNTHVTLKTDDGLVDAARADAATRACVSSLYARPQRVELCQTKQWPAKL